MNPNHLTVLLIEADRLETRRVQAALAEAHFLAFDITCAETLTTGLEYLTSRHFDLILLDLTLPDNQGIEAVLRTRTQAPDTSLITLTSDENELAGVQAVQAGAQDYLAKGQMTGGMLARVIRYALERNRMQIALRNLALTDELTDLYNRRGFVALANQYLKLVQRMQKGLLLLYLDLDGLKNINERYGYQAGDKSLVTVAQILQSTFRRADILARLGSDEFVALILGAPSGGTQALLGRLMANVTIHNSQAEPAQKISLSIGVVALDVSVSPAIDAWLTQAEQAMQQHKQRKSQVSE